MMFKLLHRPSPPAAVEERSIELLGRTIAYTLKRTRRRSIGLMVDDRGLTVLMPQRASEKWLVSVLQEKAQWAVSKLESWQAKRPAPQRWVDGAPISFRGETFMLRIVPSLFEAPPQLLRHHLIVHTSQPHDAAVIEKEVEHWMRQEALKLFTECVEHYARLMNVAPRAVKLSSARTQWGSCTAEGVVRLNWQLIKLPLRLVDYVVAHELAHLLEMNHSAAFWARVEAACPDYVKLRAELRKQATAHPGL